MLKIHIHKQNNNFKCGQQIKRLDIPGVVPLVKKLYYIKIDPKKIYYPGLKECSLKLMTGIRKTYLRISLHFSSSFLPPPFASSIFLPWIFWCILQPSFEPVIYFCWETDFIKNNDRLKKNHKNYLYYITKRNADLI